jgi:hypothetical protein
MIQQQVALMKNVHFLVVLFLVSTFALGRDVAVRGHVTKKGKYVAPSHRTSPDHTQRNNYSARGNVNPHTGKKGTKKPKH